MVFLMSRALYLTQGMVWQCLTAVPMGARDNIIAEVSDTFPGRRVRIMAGGFHLFNKTEEYVSDFAKKLRDTGVEQIWTGHCTGGDAYQILKKELGGMVHQLKAGAEISLG